ncbi:MAG: transglutaminase domain-containing protein, partial [Spirochaetes bacterium]|nr:transglutaminase domain-containing protein [Spirochaetota bacterium]
MKILNKLLIIKILSAFILSVIVPYFLTYFYILDRSYFFIFIFTISSYLLFLLNFLLKKVNVVSFILKILLIVLYFITAVYIFLRIVIIPYPFYQAWFLFIQNNQPGGIISYIFIFLISYFIALFSGLTFYFGFLRPLSAMGLTFSIMLSISLQKSENYLFFLLIILISVILCLFFLTFLPLRKNFLPFYSSIRTLILSLILSLILFLLTYSKSGWLSEYSLTPNFKNLIKSFVPGIPFLPEMEGHGNFFETKGLGGKLVLHKQPVFEIKAKPRDILYLRIKVFQKYTGSGWERDKSLKKESEKRSELIKSVINDAEKIKIKLLADYYSLLPHTLDTVSIKMEKVENLDFNYADFDSGFELSLPFIKGTELVLGRGDKNNEKIFDESIYLNIPLLLRKKIENSEFNFKDKINQYDILKKVKSILINNYNYSIYSNIIKLDEDFVGNFLFNEKKGYCEHFASSMALLARYFNIPTRFVTGYLVVLPSDKDTTVCTGMMAHAWAEIFLKDQGWTVWEATPPMDYFESDIKSFDDLLKNYDKNTLKQIKEMFNYNVQVYDKKIINYYFFIKFLLIILFVVIFFSAFFVIINLFKKDKLKISFT